MKLTEQLLSGNSSSSITGTLLRGARMGVQAEVVELLDVLTRTVPGHAQGSTHGTQQDPEVQPQTPVIDIPSIQFEPPAEGDVLPAVDLRPARDAGLDVVSSGLLRRVMRQVLGQERAGAHETHLSREDVPELRQLVDACPPQEATEASEALVVGKRPSVGCALFHPHGAELHQGERLAPMPGAHLAEEDGPARGQEDGDRGEEEDRAREKQDRARREDVEDPLHHGCRSTPSHVSLASAHRFEPGPDLIGAIEPLGQRRIAARASDLTCDRLRRDGRRRRRTEEDLVHVEGRRRLPSSTRSTERSKNGA
jgi:hypothetical protein